MSRRTILKGMGVGVALPILERGRRSGSLLSRPHPEAAADQIVASDSRLGCFPRCREHTLESMATPDTGGVGSSAIHQTSGELRALLDVRFRCLLFNRLTRGDSVF